MHYLQVLDLKIKKNAIDFMRTPLMPKARTEEKDTRLDFYKKEFF